MTKLYIRNRRVLQTAVLTYIATLVLAIFSGTVFAQSERSDTPLSTSEIARRVTPTVVTIETPTGHGSGVIVDPSGVVVTNLHVIQGETEVELALHNGDIYDDVAVVDVDERRDLVLLKIKAFNVGYATFGDSDDVEVGQDVVLVGSPQGLDSTVSVGVISAIRDSGNGYRLIQTSAPASPGSSGGGMFNLYGELIGIVTSQTREGQNLNFAVPVNYVRGLVSAEATMTLTDLTERARSASGETPERPNSASTADNIDLADTKELSAIIENLKVIDDLYDVLELEDTGDGLWIATYKKVDNLDKVHIGIQLIADEFDKSIVWISSILPGLDTDLTASQLQEILELSYNLNIAKVVLDDEGNIRTMAEAELRTLDSLGLFRTVYAVADAADRVMGTLNRTTDQATALRRSRQSGDTSIDLLNGNIVVRYSPSEWLEQSPEVSDVDMQLQHRSGEVLVFIISERLQIPQSNVPDMVLNGVRDKDPDARILRRGSRTVNGVSVIYWEHTATIDGIDFAYLSHTYSNSNGTVQIIGGTTPNLIEEHRSTIENFVAGLEVSLP